MDDVAPLEPSTSAARSIYIYMSADVATSYSDPMPRQQRPGEHASADVAALPLHRLPHQHVGEATKVYGSRPCQHPGEQNMEARGCVSLG